MTQMLYFNIQYISHDLLPHVWYLYEDMHSRYANGFQGKASIQAYYSITANVRRT